MTDRQAGRQTDRQTDRHGLWRETTPKPNTWQHLSHQFTHWSSGQGDGSASVMAIPQQQQQQQQQKKAKATKQHPRKEMAKRRKLQLETLLETLEGGHWQLTSAETAKNEGKGVHAPSECTSVRTLARELGRKGNKQQGGSRKKKRKRKDHEAVNLSRS